MPDFPPTPMGIDEHGTRVERMFDTVAHGYDRANRWMSLGLDVTWRTRAVATMLNDPEATADILDLCAGTMDSSLEILASFPHSKIVAGDFSAQMLEHGRSKLVGEAARHITPRRLDAHTLPFDDHSFDAVFCAFGMRNLSDLGRALKQVHRCLRPGGQLTVLEFFRPTTPVPRMLHTIYNRTVLPMVGWMATGSLDAYTYLPRSIGRFFSVEAFAELLEAHGFQQARHEPMTLSMAHVVRAERGPLIPPDDGVAARG